MDCLFCKIISKEIPATILFEDHDVIAFEDIMPQAPTHFLVIPKKHIATLNDIEDNDSNIIGKLPLVASKIAASKGVDQSGYRVTMNCNQDGGQTVYHIHMHVLAGRKMAWPPG
ncbi:histidine triad nucleotide-binding protein [Marinomonas sp. 15G1-11]|uniref:Histidine triad nucleotide-binding protein n=1 Tax=Marinomonas phaeophyticola TaxID=3004091 RepID=A0ABT4JWW9_9GAMM|nr:histidine triad nucleotide-binding protein [Marinomonas sp. 15G1-11]MCZ2722855.1 histidine triad nucleotide-binding protein [Marinomonas sp. 15G1-11]